jgi:hypothetical protein
LGLLNQGLAAPITPKQAEILGMAPKNLSLTEPKQILGSGQGQPSGCQVKRLGLTMEKPRELRQV